MLPNIGMPGGGSFRLDVESAGTSASVTDFGSFPRGALAQSVGRAGDAGGNANPVPGGTGDAGAAGGWPRR